MFKSLLFWFLIYEQGTVADRDAAIANLEVSIADNHQYIHTYIRTYKLLRHTCRLCCLLTVCMYVCKQDTLAERDTTVAERDTTIAALKVLISSYSVLICTHFYTHYLECVNEGNSQRQGRCTHQFRGFALPATVMFLSFYCPYMYVCMYVCMLFWYVIINARLS